MADRHVPVELTNMCMLTNGEYVLVQDRIDPDWPGIVFPGGHVEKGESITDSTVREFFEETGLTVEDPKLCGIQDWDWGEDGRYMVFLFKATRFHGELRSSDEGGVKWVRMADLSPDVFADGFEKIYRVFAEEGINEMFHPEGADWNAVYR